jgi:Delta7-sterol 5-desaturase
MDIVLEIVDSFTADYIYAFLLPVRPAPYGFSYGTTANATAVETLSAWQYKPATSFFSIQPSQAAYLSAWSRDNIFRQGISLFFITWYASCLLSHVPLAQSD